MNENIKDVALGEHYLIEVYGADCNSLNDLNGVKNLLMEVAIATGSTIIDVNFHRFEPQGVSGVVVLAESHLSFHSWPELNYAALDFYTCKIGADMTLAFKMLAEFFKTSKIEYEYKLRGMLKKINIES